MIVGLLLFLGSKIQAQFVFYNPIDSTYVLEFWDMHFLVKVYDEYEPLVQEIQAFYEREEHIKQREEEILAQERVLALRNQEIELLRYNNEILANQLNESKKLNKEADKTINKLKLKVKVLLTVQPLYKVGTGVGIITLAYIIINLFL